MFVRNLIGTSDNRVCSCGTWLKHWENDRNQHDVECAVRTCHNQAIDGGHVQKDNANANDDWHIIPLCRSCNNKKGQVLEIDNNIDLVSVCKPCAPWNIKI